jgi:hypothetical protein
MSESVVDATDVEETVTQVLTHFVQDGGEQAVMSVELPEGYHLFHYKDKVTKSF